MTRHEHEGVFSSLLALSELMEASLTTGNNIMKVFLLPGLAPGS